MKVLHVSPDVNGGGAAKAAYRIHCALKNTQIHSQMLVLKKQTDDLSVISINDTLVQKIRNKIFKHKNIKLNKESIHFKSGNQTLHSFGLTGYNLSSLLNKHEADVIHLHWISGMLSIEDIGKIKKPIVWTLHDMWPFCGGEHYVQDTSINARFKIGYLFSNQPAGEHGPDLNRLTWEAKIKYWKNHNFSIVGTSNWLKNCAQDSLIFKNNSIFYKIALPIDTKTIWIPTPKIEARRYFNLPTEKKLIFFGVAGNINSFYKGGDLLKNALQTLSNSEKENVEVILFGDDSVSDIDSWPLPTRNMGKITSDSEMAKLYSCADLVAVPSRQEAFGQIASEAQACGVPVVAFYIGGLIDIILHKKTGWLANPFDTIDLGRGISSLLQRSSDIELNEACRLRARKQFSIENIAKEYEKVYGEALFR